MRNPPTTPDELRLYVMNTLLSDITNGTHHTETVRQILKRRDGGVSNKPLPTDK